MRGVASIAILLLGRAALAQPGSEGAPPAPAGAAGGVPGAPGGSGGGVPGAPSGAAGGTPGPPAMGSEGAPVAPPAPQAPAPTRATFLSTTSQPWDVTVDGQAICATPCSLAIFPLQFVTLRSQEPNPVLLDVGRLPAGDLIVSGKPLDGGMYAGGIVATSLGGMAAAVGITLGAVGFATDHRTMATAGVITGVTGGIAIAGGIHLMLNALPRASIAGAPPSASGGPLGMAGRQVGIAGTF